MDVHQPPVATLATECSREGQWVFDWDRITAKVAYLSFDADPTLSGYLSRNPWSCGAAHEVVLREPPSCRPEARGVQ